MKFVSVNNENIFHLRDFIKNMGNSSETFRYFATRTPTQAIENHILTVLLMDEEPVGYGHLDKEDHIVWLGICVKEGAQGKGYGRKIMEELVTSYEGEIELTVDASNFRAIKLYESFGFCKVSTRPGIIYMRRGDQRTSRRGSFI